MPTGAPNTWVDVFSMVAWGAPTECWPWLGRTDHGGYGFVNFAGKRRRAHRVVYRLLVGPIPDGLVLDHVRARGCTDRRCCNPAHLEPVTQDENVRRSTFFESRGQRVVTHCPSGHEYTPENTRAYRGRRYCRSCNRARARRDRALNRASVSQSRKDTP